MLLSGEDYLLLLLCGEDGRALLPLRCSECEGGSAVLVLLYGKQQSDRIEANREKKSMVFWKWWLEE